MASQVTTEAERRKKKAMKKVLEINLTLTGVMEVMSCPELKVCRLICKKWNQISSQLILQSDLCYVTFGYGHRASKFYQNGTPFDLERHMCLLNDVMETSSNFPCSDFILGKLRRAGQEERLKIQATRFLEVQGQKIKTLSLSDPNDLYKLDLGVKAPNLEILAVWNDDCDTSKIEKVASPLYPHVRKFVWSSQCPREAREMLKNSPQLKAIQFVQYDPDYWANDLELVVECGHADKIPRLYIQPDDDPEKMSLFVNSKPSPRLTELNFRLDSDFSFYLEDEEIFELAVQFSKLLELCRNSLKILHVGQLCHVYQVAIPRLPNLKKLCLGQHSYLQPRPSLLINEANLSMTFPNLKSLSLKSLNSHNDSMWDIYFPPLASDGTKFSDQFTTVIHLTVNDQVTPFWMERLHDLCPNFKKLTLFCGQNLHTMLPQIFTQWRHLEGLEVTGFRTDFLQLPNSLSVDSVLTGILDDECKRLRESVDLIKIGRDQVEKLRSGPSICDLRGLKKFEILFDPDWYLWRSTDAIRISKVSHFCAFQFMAPDLKVVIEVDDIYGCDKPFLFESIAPYVNMRHKHTGQSDRESYG